MKKAILQLMRLGTILIAFALPGCEKPRLRTDKIDGADGIQEAGETGDRYENIRKSVIGKTFATLTLGSRKFTNAEVRDITDREIVIAHYGGVDKIPWSAVPAAVREQWGYNSSVGPAPTVAKKTREGKTVVEPVGIPAVPAVPAATKPKKSPQERAEEYARNKKMLNAQLVGIQSLESDFARHSQELYQLRDQLQVIRNQQAGQRSGGIRVERIDGRSTMVDRAAEARAVESKLVVQEQLVSQLSKSLDAARNKYQTMKRETDQLLQE